MTLTGNFVFLRALEPDDLDFLYQLENDESVWEISNTATPYSKHILRQYLDNAHRDIYDVKQLRLVLCKKVDEAVVGFVDLFDFEPKHKRVGVGILIFSEANRGKGFGKEALQLTAHYVFKHLGVHQIYANVGEDNTHSMRLFEKVGFKKQGVKKDWIFSEGNFKNEVLYQLFNA